MTSTIYALLGTILILTITAMQFASSIFYTLKKDFTRESRANAVNACLTYGDILVRSKSLDNDPVTRIPNKTTLNLPCLREEDGKCVEKLSCTITLESDNKIYVSIN
jgi:hypothetical protein